MSTLPTPLPTVAEEIEYPATDGKPMGETGYHVTALMYLLGALQAHFEGQQVLVTLDLFLYYTRGDRSAVKAPDVMVVKGVDPAPRRSFKTWEEKALPCVVIEATSESTVAEDLGPKRKLYAQLGVTEYFIFDPEGESLDPPLQGFRLKGGRYVRLSPAKDGSLGSKELGLRLRAEGILLRLVDAKTGTPIPTRQESEAQTREAEQAAERERQRAEQEKQRAEQEKQRAEQEKQRAEQEKQRAEQEKQRAEQEKQRAEQEKQRAEQEKQRADALAAQMARLQEELERQKRQP